MVRLSEETARGLTESRACPAGTKRHACIAERPARRLRNPGFDTERRELGRSVWSPEGSSIPQVHLAEDKYEESKLNNALEMARSTGDIL